jgi:hypothetical protein
MLYQNGITQEWSQDKQYQEHRKVQRSTREGGTIGAEVDSLSMEGYSMGIDSKYWNQKNVKTCWDDNSSLNDEIQDAAQRILDEISGLVRQVREQVYP